MFKYWEINIFIFKILSQQIYSMNYYLCLSLGASAGIGRQIALLFTRNGAKIAIAARTVQGLEETRDLCAKHVKQPATDVQYFDYKIVWFNFLRAGT